MQPIPLGVLCDPADPAERPRVPAAGQPQEQGEEQLSAVPDQPLHQLALQQGIHQPVRLFQPRHRQYMTRLYIHSRLYAL